MVERGRPHPNHGPSGFGLGSGAIADFEVRQGIVSADPCGIDGEHAADRTRATEARMEATWGTIAVKCASTAF